MQGTLKTIEETYQKKTPLEHIRDRPDTYIGSIDPEPISLYLPDEKQQLVEQCVQWVPGLYKIFDEILVNAADHKQNHPHLVTAFKINVSPEKIQIWNDGPCIPIAMHSEYKCYVPELIFGHPFTGSNYDDTKKKTVGGKNGVGAKCTAVFCKRFEIETYSASSQQLYRQVFSDNLTVINPPSICVRKGTSDYTCLILYPDYAKFSQESLSPDMIKVFHRRCIDMAGTCSGTKIYWNGSRIPVSNFKQYCLLYGSESKIMHCQPHERWTVALSTSSSGKFEQVSFVNNIATLYGGTHVSSIVTQVTDFVIEKLGKKYPDLKPGKIKNNLRVFVNCIIDDPSYDSQSKKLLTTPKTKFGSTCTLEPSFMQKFLKDHLQAKLLEHLVTADQQELAKTDGGKKRNVTGFDKLHDAELAGTRHSDQAVLILTEGDSAKALAISGLGALPPQEYRRYGVFPLKGKPVNVRDATASDINKNEEFVALKQILGLQMNTVYEDTKKLRYGRVVIFADSDHDAYHIIGLICNVFDVYWPSLLKMPGFLSKFITPIVKCTKGSQVISFYKQSDYKSWKDVTPNASSFKPKYYKGLGTSTPAEGREYFSDLPKHIIPFLHDDDSSPSLKLAFAKNMADARKDWVAKEDSKSDCPRPLPYSDFVNRELVQYSRYSNERAIPSVMDGLKPGQRKPLWACMDKNIVTEQKVSEIAGLVTAHCSFHHGEASLHQTIIAMAQDFPGSNNIPYLVPAGQFGSRSMGGKDAASPRYIFTRLDPRVRAIFPPQDDAILQMNEDDGKTIEPRFLVPIIPTILLNGVKGIGTGWSTEIPAYNPMDLIALVESWLSELSDSSHVNQPELHPDHPLIPYYSNFTGRFERTKTGFICHGVYHYSEDGTTLIITDLPIGKWTLDYKCMLDKLVERGDVDAYNEYHTHDTINFSITGKSIKTIELFKLTTSLSTSNMNAFTATGHLKHYATTTDLVRDWFEVRKEYYAKRMNHMMTCLLKQHAVLLEKRRFVQAVIDGTLDFRGGKSKRQLEQSLEDLKFTKFETNDYDYLLSLSIWSFTADRIESLAAELLGVWNQIEALKSETITTVWKKDLQNLSNVLNGYKEKTTEQKKRKLDSDPATKQKKKK